jgi:hypothetical protein
LKTHAMAYKGGSTSACAFWAVITAHHTLPQQPELHSLRYHAVRDEQQQGGISDDQGRKKAKSQKFGPKNGPTMGLEPTCV